jgi:acyl-coenzyme A thioesterase PaaI-like protein
MAARGTTGIGKMFKWWRRLNSLPGGRWLFSKLVGGFAPYTGSINARIVALEPGHVVCELRDRRRVRNHLNSIHAIALANLGEVTSGLAQMSVLGPGQRGIVTNLSIEYFKKARGTLRAESNAEEPTVHGNEDVELDVTCDIRDAAGDVVAQTTVRWRIGQDPNA